MPLDLPLLVPAIRLDRDDGREESIALRRAHEPWVAGFLLFGGRAEQVARLTARLRHDAGRPIFIASDMERGAGQQVQGLTRLPDAGLVGLGGTPDDAEALGAITGREARSVGVDVIFAPCVDVRSELDNPILGNRAFGFDPHRVGVLGAAFAAGVCRAGALPVAKHFPGHGATREDSHDALAVVRASRETLAMRDLPPFERLLGVGAVPAVMTAHVAYPALDASGAIATFSKPIVDLARSYVPAGRPDLVVFTDALIMAGALADGDEAEATRRALRAGCDALLYPEAPEALAAQLAGVPDLRPDLERAAQSLATFLGQTAGSRPELERGMTASDEAAPLRLARRALRLALDGDARQPSTAVVVLDDDGIENRGAVLAAAADAQRPVYVLRADDDPVAWLGREHPPRSAEHWTLLVIASARAWKGASGVSPGMLQRVHDIQAWLHDSMCATSRVVWCTPRGIGAGGAHLPGSGPHLEQALAEILLGVDAGRHGGEGGA